MLADSRTSDWDKQHGVDMEHARLMQHTKDVVAKGQLAEHMWHSASHVEHVRPMLQVQLNLDKRSPTGAEKTARLQCFGRLARSQHYAHIYS